MDAYGDSMAADALAMPVHCYHDREDLRRDYGTVDHFKAPRNPHPGSILWRSSYTALNGKGDILREQVRFCGKQEIRYHQFLTAGEKTLGFKLADQLAVKVLNEFSGRGIRFTVTHIETVDLGLLNGARLEKPTAPST